MPAIRRILCPVDFSETSDRAAHYAVQLARQVGASVHFAHAWEMPVYAFPDGTVILGAEVVAQVTSALQKNLDALLARHREPGVAVTAHLVQGPPERETTRLTEELDADLVVMGTHGRTGLTHALLGSVAERVVRSSRVPVLTVPPKRD